MNRLVDAMEDISVGFDPAEQRALVVVIRRYCNESVDLESGPIPRQNLLIPDGARVFLRKFRSLSDTPRKRVARLVLPLLEAASAASNRKRTTPRHPPPSEQGGAPHATARREQVNGVVKAVLAALGWTHSMKRLQSTNPEAALVYAQLVRMVSQVGVTENGREEGRGPAI